MAQLASSSRSHSPYREVTPAAMVTGLLIGIGMTATFTYAGMTLGFSTSGSTVAAILGWGVLRGLLRRGTIVENNIVQTIASSLNTTAGGVVFTVPVLFLLPGWNSISGRRSAPAWRERFSALDLSSRSENR